MSGAHPQTSRLPGLVEETWLLLVILWGRQGSGITRTEGRLAKTPERLPGHECKELFGNIAGFNSLAKYCKRRWR